MWCPSSCDHKLLEFQSRGVGAWPEDSDNILAIEFQSFVSKCLILYRLSNFMFTRINCYEVG